MRKPIIAVVDDQSFICDMVKTILERDYDVHTFTKGEALLQFMSKMSVDLLLLDYDMPEMTGYEVLLSARSDKSFGETKPIIFLTVESNERMKMEMLKRGATDYLTKPLNSAELSACIKKHLEGKGTANA
jgi:DNA-binding response OmpR family regulator